MFVREELQQLMPCAHGGRLHEIAEQKGLKEKDILDFSVNVNPYLPIDPKAIVLDALTRITEYPDNSYDHFRESAARFTGVSKKNIVPGNGSTEIIRLFAEMAITKGDIVAVPCPTFGEYEQQCRLFGAHMRYVKYGDLLKWASTGILTAVKRSSSVTRIIPMASSYRKNKSSESPVTAGKKASPLSWMRRSSTWQIQGRA